MTFLAISMPNCPACGTWNPDDKHVCWRCQAELPKPTPQKPKRRTQVAGLPLWMWLALILFLMVLVLGQCFFLAGPPAQ